jgi:serine/threonine-protein kinase
MNIPLHARHAPGNFGLTSAVVLLASFVVLQVVARDFTLRLETHYFDLFSNARHTRPNDRILLVDAPTETLRPKDAVAMPALIDKLAGLGTESIILAMTPGPEVNQRDVVQLQTLVQLQERAQQYGVEVGAVTQNSLRAELDVLRAESDRQVALTDSVRRAGNVYLAIPVTARVVSEQDPCAARVVAIPEGLRPLVTGSLRHVGGKALGGALCEAAAGVGHSGYWPDADGRFRRTELLVGIADTVLPSLALMVAASATKGRHADLMVDTTGALRFGDQQFSVPTHFVSFNYYYENVEDGATFPAVKARDLLNNDVDTGQFRDRIAVVGSLAPRDTELFRLPDETLVTRSVLIATSLSNLLNNDMAIRPGSLRGWEALVMALTGLLLLLISIVRSLLTRIICVALLASVIFAGELFLLFAQGIWMHLITVAFFVLVSAGCLEIMRSFYPALEGPASRTSHAANSDMLIGHDALDMEFSILRNSAPTAETKEHLYSLAKRYIHARHYSKAERVLRCLVAIDPEYRRAQKKLLELPGGRSAAAEPDSRTDVSQDSPKASASAANQPIGDRRTSDRRAGDQRKRGRRASDLVSTTEQPTIQTLGRYRLIRELGHGAMAHVYLAEDPEIRRQVAIKTLALADEFEDKDLEKAQDQFTREARSAGRLNHPNIIAIYDFGVEDGLSYLAMEYFAGNPLSDWATPKNFLPVTWVLELMAQTADALHYAHSQQVIHRDIKPANLLYDTGRDLIKITDFGIARLTDNNKTRSGIIMGTPFYMPPEQLRGEPVTGRADLYALGVCMYQLLTGCVPFRAVALPKLMEQVLRQKHEPVIALRDDLPPDVDEILNLALAKNPDDRFVNGRAMAVALREIARASAA